jgi:hypothetical protein
MSACGAGKRANERTHIVDVLVQRKTRQIRRAIRERTQDPRRREVLLRVRLARKREALNVPTHIAQRARRSILLLHGDEAHIEAQRHGLRFRRAAIEAREYVRRHAEIRAAQQWRPVIDVIVRITTIGIVLIVLAGKSHCAVGVPVVLERPQLRLSCEPLRERFGPGKETCEPLEAERAAVQDPHVVVVDWPWSLPRPPEVIRRCYRQVFQVHQYLHRLRYHVRVLCLRLTVYGACEG